MQQRSKNVFFDSHIPFVFFRLGLQVSVYQSIHPSIHTLFYFLSFGTVKQCVSKPASLDSHNLFSFRLGLWNSVFEA